MRLALLPILVFSSAALFAGCTTDNDVDGSGGSPNTLQPYEAKTNCVMMSEDDACEALIDAITDNIGRLECVPKTMPACPEYLRQSVVNKEEGLSWDQGSIDECVRFYDSFDSCEQFETRPCIVKYYPKNVPTGCPEPDAGAEAATGDGAVQDDAATQQDGAVQDDAAVQEDGATQDDAAVQEDGAVQDDAAAQEDAAVQPDASAPADDAQAD